MEVKQTPPSENRSRMKRNGFKIDRTLLELSIGIVLWGLICQLTVVWFVQDKAGYSLGLWIGVLLGVAAAAHMWWSLDHSLEYVQDAAVKMMTKHNILRYVAIVIVMGIIMVSGFANPLSAFLGLMGLKVAAYIQPFTHKICTNLGNHYDFKRWGIRR